MFSLAVIMEPLMWQVSAIPWKVSYGPQVQKNACAINEKTIGGTK
jgi:hypothetical protein